MIALPHPERDHPEPVVDLAAVAARFADRLHAAGVAVTPDRAGRFAAATALAVPLSTTELYWLGRVTLAANPTEIATFDRVFLAVFRGLTDHADFRGDRARPDLADVTRGEPRREPGTVGVEAPPQQTPPSPYEDAGDHTDDGTGTESPVGAPASAIEVLRHRDFARCTSDDLQRLRVLMARMRIEPPMRITRRRRRHPRGDVIDRRRTLRRAHRTGGHTAVLARRRSAERPRRVILIADVSGSMERYTRAYLVLLHGAVRALRAEAFVFATRLTRLTPRLRVADPDVALRSAVAEVADWSGGTRIGAAIKEFNDRWGRRGLARGAVVVVVSDGWEQDDPIELSEQMARLSRLAHRIVWVNPRTQSDRYEPLVGGMKAALPYVDHLASGHSLAALEDVLAAIAGA